MQITFKHSIGDRVTIIASGEAGVVRALSIDHANGQQALVHYLAGDHRATSSWWEVDLIAAVPVTA